MKKAIFSCQNNQELMDLVLIAKDLKLKHGYSIVFYNMEGVTGQQIDYKLLDIFDVKYNAHSLFNKNIRDFGLIGKLLLSLYNAINLMCIFHKEKSKLFIMGVPLLVYRLLSFISFGQIKTISYIRSIIVQSGGNTSISSRFFLRFAFLAKFDLFRRVISDYYSDVVICIGDVTAEFLESRSVPKGNIYTIGSVFCDENFFPQKTNELPMYKRIVFLSSAFSSHGYKSSQEKQMELIVDVYNYINSLNIDNCQFIVRKHPREPENEYARFKSLGGIVDEDGYTLNCGDKDTLYVSVVSTLLFELTYVGESTLLISNDFFKEQFHQWYEKLNVKPCLDWKKEIYSFNSYGNNYYSQLDVDFIISNQYKGRVVTEIVNLVDRIC